MNDFLKDVLRATRAQVLAIALVSAGQLLGWLDPPTWGYVTFWGVCYVVLVGVTLWQK